MTEARPAQPNADEAHFLQEGNALQAMAGGSPDRRQGVVRPPQRRLTRQRLKIGEAQSHRDRSGPVALLAGIRNDRLDEVVQRLRQRAAVADVRLERDLPAYRPWHPGGDERTFVDAARRIMKIAAVRIAEMKLQLR